MPKAYCQYFLLRFKRNLDELKILSGDVLLKINRLDARKISKDAINTVLRKMRKDMGEMNFYVQRYVSSYVRSFQHSY